MREKEETIQAVVDSRVATDGEATVYTSARFRYLMYLLQVLPMVITVSFVLDGVGMCVCVRSANLH